MSVFYRALLYLLYAHLYIRLCVCVYDLKKLHLVGNTYRSSAEIEAAASTASVVVAAAAAAGAEAEAAAADGAAAAVVVASLFWQTTCWVI